MSVPNANALLERWGLLLLQDARLPNLAKAVAGEPVRGSWWAHAAGKDIYRAANEVAADPDVMVAKLVSGKVTFVHRSLWPCVVAVGSVRRPWQVSSLSKAARALLVRVDHHGTLRATGPAVKELELAWLVASKQVHTDKGAHALELTSWKAFMRREGLARRNVCNVSEERARQKLEKLFADLSAACACAGEARLPWQRGPLKRVRSGGRA